MEAYSFNQLLSMVCSISGQGSRGLAASHQPSKFCSGRFDQCSDFSPVFHLSPDEKKQLTHDPVIEPKSKNSLVQRMPRDVPERQKYFADEEVHHFGKLPLSLVLINALGGSISGIYNLQPSLPLLSVEL